MRNIRSIRLLPWSICMVIWLASLYAANQSPAAMADAASKFLATLSPEQRKIATFPFDAAEREHWGFLPTERFPRSGLTVAAMNERQRTAAHALLKAGLSQKGYLTTLEAPDFRLPDMNGKLHALSDFRGKKVLLLTWASW